MSAIEFVVRKSAGEIQRGVAAGDASTSVILGAGDDVSLNLDPSSVLSYGRQGQALEVVLMDGRIIVVEGFFSPTGVIENELFLSANGELVRADLVALDNGVLYASYVEQDAFGKWSPDDALYFVGEPQVQLAGYQEIAPVDTDVQAGMLAAPLLGGIAGLGGFGIGSAAAGAAVIGGASLLNGGGTSSTPNSGGETNEQSVAITQGTESQNHVVNNADYTDGATISGKGIEGAVIEVTVQGVTEATTVDENGDWSVTFDPTDLPSGEYETDVTVTSTINGETVTVNDTLVVDTQTSVSIQNTSGGSDGVVNATEIGGGLSLSGAAEAGSTVMVTVGGVAYEATVSGSSWTLDLPAGAVSGGEYGLGVVVDATDSHGNTAQTTSTIQIDTETFVTINTSSIGGNGILNADERLGGFDVGGTAQPFASIAVSFGGTTHNVTANSAGNWTTNFHAGEIAPGTYDATVTAVAMDGAGNSAQASGNFVVDTIVDDYAFSTDPVSGDGTISGSDVSGGLTLTGSVEPNSKVEVTFNGFTKTVYANGDGDWSAQWSANQIPQGEGSEQVIAKATDPNGNVKTLTSTVNVDTIVNNLTGASAVTADDTVNATELGNGVTITGTVEPGSRVFVDYGGTRYEATVADNGAWSLSFPSGTFPAGEYTAQLDILAIDRFGNEREAQESFQVDTIAPDAPYVVSANFYEGKLGDIGIPDNDTSIKVYDLDGQGGADQLDFTAVAGRFDTVELQLDTLIPDGRQLVVTTEDTAGNMNATLMVFDQADTDLVNIDDAGLNGFEISAIDLQYATSSDLTLNEADIDRLAGNVGSLTVHGASDDHVTLENAVANGTTTIDGDTYDIYTLGTDGVLIIDEDINVTI